MSVANVEQPPSMLFGQQPPSSPPFSNPQSPTETQHTQQPMSSPPTQPSEDIDMSTSTTLSPTGQRHDREDAVMQDGLTNGVETYIDNAASNEATSNVAVEVAAVPADEDAMDTTPDNSQGLVVPNGSGDTQEAASVTPSSPAANGVNQEESGNGNQALPPPPPPPLADDASQAEIAPPAEPPQPTDDSVQPPPPPPPAEPVRSDSDSSDDDDGSQSWQPIQEDTSTPDEDELKEIEEGTEVSALNHEHWEQKAFLTMEDPEYIPGESGRIEWLIENYNGTKEKPNRDLVMKSNPVTIGGYDWQIKFYPKGNDSDYLSVYVECLSVYDKEQRKSDIETSSDVPQDTDAMITSQEESALAPWESQHTPLPLLDSVCMPKRKSVAAQVSVVLYNPSEPRVNYSRTCLHRFCANSPDWGWTRFQGPYYDIPNRARGQRQALLRNDKLAFTGYIRIITDETNCLWEHPSSDNTWDSFAMTGLQSLALGDGPSYPGGNLISTISSWMLFKPFRQFLYSVQVPDHEAEPFTPPKPLLGALQKLLYMLRTQVQPGAGSVTLEDVLDALEWYGIQERLDKLDVVAISEYLRGKIEDELRDTPFVDALERLLGPKRDYSLGVPSYRVPVVGVGSMQEAVHQSPDLTVAESPLPQLLTIELERQAFDAASRSYVKLLNKVSLNDHIELRGTSYTLYGFIVHKQTLQSYVYQPILRPEGPGSKWYSYSDSRDGNMVKCLTKRQAIGAHEGKEGSERVTGSDPVAYIAMYVRDDIAGSAFAAQADTEQWDVPQWIRKEVGKGRTAKHPPPIPPPPSDEQASEVEETKPAEEPTQPEERQFQVINSKAFLQHEGPGFFDAYNNRWQPTMSDLVYSVQLKATDGFKEVHNKLTKVIPDIQDPRQVKFWFLDPILGSLGRPNLLLTGKMEYSSGTFDRYTEQIAGEQLQNLPLYWSRRRLWVHIIDVADLPELPKEVPKEEPQEPAQSIQAEPAADSSTSVVDAPPRDDSTLTDPQALQPPTTVTSEDTPMSEPDEPVTPQLETNNSEVEISAPSNDSNGGTDTAMVEVDAPAPPDPPAVDVIVTDNAGDDTEMGDPQEDVAPPTDASIPLAPTDLPSPPPPADLPVPLADTPAPPPPTDLPPEPAFPPNDPLNISIPPPPEPEPPVQERPPTPPPPPDEVYIFLKFFDAEKQNLESKGSYIVQASSRLEATVAKLLDLPSDQKIELFEEEELISTRLLRGRKSFTQNDLHNTAIIVYFFPLNTDQRNALAARAAFADLPSFLAFRASARNFPSKLNGHFTHNYFSSQYYKGEIKNGHRHGYGYRIYHSGATYEGTFRLSQRHGHGLYTFQNGDTYDGDWEVNQQHGSGTFVEATTGNTYVGGWKNDKKFGEGVTHWKNAQETERLCRICWEDTADAAFYDCGHVVACLTCARQVENCPVCRKRVLSAMKLFYVA